MGGPFETSRLPISAKKKKENVEHPAGVHCQRTGYSLRRLSNIVSYRGRYFFIFKGFGYEIIEQVN